MVDKLPELLHEIIIQKIYIYTHLYILVVSWNEFIHLYIYIYGTDAVTWSYEKRAIFSYFITSVPAIRQFYRNFHPIGI